MIAALKRFWQAGMAAARGQQAAPEMSNYSLDAARLDDAWGYTYWPLRTNDEWDASALLTAYKRARSLYDNCPPIRCAVDQMVRFAGVLTPLPETNDDVWNELAREAWDRRTKNPQLFDIAGRVNYRQAMRFCERRAIIDGDVCVVPTFAPDGGAAFKFYCSPQIGGGGVYGVEADKHGRALAYWLIDEDGKAQKIAAWHAVLYQHNPDPCRLRGHTMLAPALRNGRDVLTIVGLAKQGVKMASSMGAVATKSANSNALDFGREMPGSGDGKKKAPMRKKELGTGLDITFMPEGYDVKTISDTRPSTQLQAFFVFLIRLIAQGVSLDPEMLYTTNELSSAATRFSLEKLKRYQEAMAEDQAVLASRMWRHVIGREIATGLLRPCADPAWTEPRWVQDRDMTIDTARVSQAHINQIREGVADNEDYTLRTTGRTPLQLARRRALELAKKKEIAEEFGLTLAELFPGQVGTVQPAPADEPDDEKRDSKPARKDDAEGAEGAR